MAQSVVSQCPFCQGVTEVSEVTCLACDVQMRGHFTLSRYDRLAPEQQQFLEAFLRSRGVIRDVEATLGISYPTVRARLDSLLATLGFAEGPMTRQKPEEMPGAPVIDKAARRREILEAISSGRLDAQAGLDALQKLTE